MNSFRNKILSLLLVVLAAPFAVAQVCLPGERTPQTYKDSGRWIQAPEACGDIWCQQTPFNKRPWSKVCDEDSVKPPTEQVPAGFVDVFGNRPQSSDFAGTPNPSLSFRIAVGLWEQNLKHFKKAGPPEWISENPEIMNDIEETTKFWGLGTPKYYEGRYGYMVRFPDAKHLTDLEYPAYTIRFSLHNAIASYQQRLFSLGIAVPVCHEWIRKSDCILEPDPPASEQ